MARASRSSRRQNCPLFRDRPRCNRMRPLGRLGLIPSVPLNVTSSPRAHVRSRIVGVGVPGATVATKKGNRTEHENPTFRLDTSIIDAIRRDSADEGLSANSLANRQLERYTEWDRLESKFGFMTLRDRMFRDMLARVSPADLAALGREQGPVEATEYMLLRWKAISLANFVRFVKNYAKFATQFELQHHVADGHELVFVHSLGENWSVYLEAFMLAALEGVFGIHAESERTDESVVLTFPDVNVPAPKGPE